MLLFRDWQVCRGFDCTNDRPKLPLQERSFVRQSLRRLKQDAYAMVRLRNLLIWERTGWDLSRMPDDAVIEQIAELLISGRFHVHVETATIVSASIHANDAASSGESQPAFPLSGRGTHSASESSHRSADAVDPPSFGADTDFAAQAAVLVAAASLGAPACYICQKLREGGGQPS